MPSDPDGTRLARFVQRERSHSTAQSNDEAVEKRLRSLVALERGRSYDSCFTPQCDFRKALDAYSEAIAVDPTNFLAFCERGYDRLHFKDKLGALADFKQATVVAPENSGANALSAFAMVAPVLRMRSRVDCEPDSLPKRFLM